MMFSAGKNKRSNLLLEAIRFFDLLYHTTVRNVRRVSFNPIIAIVNQILTMLVLVAAFMMLTTLLGTRTAAVRGNSVQFIMSGIFLFLVHNSSLGAAALVGGLRTPLTLHTHITHFMLVMSAGMAALYIQILAVVLIFTVTHILVEPVVFQSLAGFSFAFFIAWASGLMIGFFFSVISPYSPRVVELLKMLYMRSNMIFSGKMFVANTIPASILPYFYWNPLFHTIDYARGESFINYTPRVININYPIVVTIIFFVLALIFQRYGQNVVSASWNKRS
ncbi:MAG: ABC transporter permease [Pseudomonadota bacterium]